MYPWRGYSTRVVRVADQAHGTHLHALWVAQHLRVGNRTTPYKVPRPPSASCLNSLRQIHEHLTPLLPSEERMT